MADTTIKVDVDTRDAIRALSGLKTAFELLIGAATVKGLIDFSDGITSLRNKLISITPDLTSVNKQFSAIAAIAITSRTPLESVADLYSRIQRSAKALGISQAEVAQITDSLSKALSASGISGKEAAGPLLQLGQALQSGTFQGDELRSILEALPPVAQALADQLGVPVGALKKLGSEGQINADVFVKAMRKAKDSIDEAFGRTTPTISSAIEGLRTNAKLAFDEFERNTSTGKNLALTIEYLGFQIFKLTKNIDQISSFIGTLLQIGAAIAAFTIAGRVFRAVVVVIEGMAASFVMWRAALSNAIDFVKNFSTVMRQLGGGFEALWATLTVILKPFSSFVGLVISGAAALYAWSGIGDLIDKVKGLGDSTSDGAKELEAYREELAKMKTGLDDSASASENAKYRAEELAKKLGMVRLEMQQQVNGVERSLKQTQERLALENEFLSMNRERIQISENEIAIGKATTDIDIERRNALAQITDQLKKMNQEYANMRVKDSDGAKELKGRIGILQDQAAQTDKIYSQQIAGMAQEMRRNQNLKLLEEDRKRNQEIIIKSIEDQIARTEKLGESLRSINDQKVNLKFEAGEMGKNPLQKQIDKIVEESRKAALEAGRAFSAAFSSEDGLTVEKAQELADGLDKIAKGYQGIAQAQIDNLNKSREFTTGLKESVGAWADNWTNNANVAKMAVDSMTKGMESAIDKFVETGKFSFGDFTRSVLMDLEKIAIKQALVGFAKAAFAGTGIGSLLGFAAGGIIPTNNPVMVGENGPEILVGAAGKRVIPNNQIGGGSTTIINNISAIDAKSVAQLFAENRMTLFGNVEQARRELPMRTR